MAREGNEFTIRGVRRADFAAVAALAGQLGYAATRAEIEHRLKEIAATKDHDVFVAEARGGEILGYVDVMVMITAESDARVEVAGLVVADKSRRKGVGEELMKQAEEWGRKRGCKLINLRSNVLREAAHAFYARLGYEHYKTQKAFRKRICDS
ncbi:MAG: GNAT family N-acetyltransferase [Candidatus Acidiferrales bacterium]